MSEEFYISLEIGFAHLLQRTHFIDAIFMIRFFNRKRENFDSEAEDLFFRDKILTYVAEKIARVPSFQTRMRWKQEYCS
jgi:hypothetical protein